MPVAVQLFLDTERSAPIRHIWQSLADIGVTYMVDVGATPHVTLAIWDEVEPAAFSEIAPGYAGSWSEFEFSFTHVGAFASGSTVFAAPIVGRELIDRHEVLHDMSLGAPAALSEYYVPGRWNPHCTLAMEFADAQWESVFELCRREWTPLVAGIESVALIEFGKGPVTVLSEHPVTSG